MHYIDHDFYTLLWVKVLVADFCGWTKMMREYLKYLQLCPEGEQKS